MESRVKKYYNEDNHYETSSETTRSGRNVRLYRQVYGKYDDLDNLPIEDNTDEIDMERLKELVLNKQEEKEAAELKEHLNVLEQKKRNIDEQRVYDINKILEKAKYENNKLKDTTSIPKINRDILTTLQSSELSLAEIKKASEVYETKTELQSQLNVESQPKLNEEQLSMTRELKYKNLEQQLEQEQQEKISEKVTMTNDLSLDLFEDLKPTGNTIVTKPIREEEVEIKQVNGFKSSDTRDIDIIKNEGKEVDNDFFTSSYHFSQKDFASDDDFYDTKKKSGIWKILFLLLAITIFVGVIVYFIGTYGLGI